MSRKNKSQAAEVEHAPGEVVTHGDGSTETFNPPVERDLTAQEKKQAAALAKIQAKAEKKAAAEAKKAARLAAIPTDADKEAKKAARIAAHADRAARIAALIGENRKYVGSMLALADRVKQGVYVKGSTGQLRSNDDLAQSLDIVPVDNVIKLGKILFDLEVNPYIHLNVGQQSMNFRNKMRGAIGKGTLTIERVREVIEQEGFATAFDWAAERAAKKAAREAKALVNAEAKAAKVAAKALTAAAETETA